MLCSYQLIVGPRLKLDHWKDLGLKVLKLIFLLEVASHATTYYVVYWFCAFACLGFIYYMLAHKNTVLN